jgi:hypothetical protein
LAAEQRYYSRECANLPTKDSADYWRALIGARLPKPKLLSREKVNGIQGGDDLATDQQLLQIVAITELFVAEDADPKI